jgi:hypothetical protein
MAGQDSIPELVRNMRLAEDRAIVTHAFPTKPLPHGLQMIFKEYDYATYASSFQVQQEGDGTSITQNPNLGLIPERNSVQQKNTSSLELPFPRSLRDATGVQVTAFERDFLYERLASGAAGLMSGKTNADILGNISQFISDSLGSARDLGKAFASKGVFATLEEGVGKLFSSSGEETKSIAAYLAQKYLSGDLAKTASAALGKVVNPQQTLAFEGVNLREFTFEWELFPANKSDTEKITEIIRFLKLKMLPELNGVAGIKGLERAFLKYPSVVELSLLGVQEKHFVRFKRAMISDVNVDYSGGASQVSIIKGGVPASVTLSITFKELSIQTANDYRDEPPSPGPSAQTSSTINPGNTGQ